MAKKEFEKITAKKKNLQLQLVVIKYYKSITFIFVGLILFLGYYFILEPKYNEVGVGGKYNLSTMQEELNKRKAYLDNLRKLNNNYQNINQTEIEKLKQILPSDQDIPGLFVQLQSLAEESGLLLAGVSINEVPEAKKIAKGSSEAVIKKLNVSLNLISTGKGSYEEVKIFLTALEDNLRLFDVNSVYFAPDSANYSINLFTYYYSR
ncbi:MAG: type 4a pilus biogenesis protein PilO [Patescibacteria group bacterium]|jgi:Tfp pilus assembly protein PilO